MSNERLNPETHRLTDITGGDKHPLVCQSCGGSHRLRVGNGLIRLTLSRWQECDHNDQPEQKIVVLCNVCSKRVIEPHPRLYHQLHYNTPWPGCMDICVDCRFRSGIKCVHPAAKVNGGAGVMLKIGKITRGFIDYAGKNGKISGSVFEHYETPASDCKQKQPAL